ncbi:nucleoside-diphosphate-sugar epimerase [Candidatus Mancarchaeum acidiphilum]|uniref:Nucleoside-diphosphate-sugar epimerase n=1 Tax=Candidatus Mancarchaeum acidiphilum TaxID=1920749 RepID=A0A218NMC8_9ARCH|nr:UDP-sulfoquinovose synthase [Candidatus Mancarchaeum acidiphilum]ASI13617.1 nucleoside-diphosphate-sugar epimerase [Candidatus Mancarchaeum acidiphilum]
MKIMILGIDGYIGWALGLRLIANGHDVIGVDNFYTRKAVREVGSDSALPLPSMETRIKEAKKVFGKEIQFYNLDIKNFAKISELIKRYKPDAIVDFAEQRSAPYSMVDAEHAIYTMHNNIEGTINVLYAIKQFSPDTHLVKMGTMGEYGTPKFDIPESAFVNTSINGKEDLITVPKWGGSWYHWSKVHDTNDILFANKIWGITATDIMQGPVYGTRTKEIVNKKLFTRLDFDGVWGTVINRYCVEAILGMPLTPYGKGGQTRAFLSLEDSVESLKRLIENPPNKGEYRVVNQFTEIYTVMELANEVKAIAEKLGINAEIKPIENPRVEAEQHYYNPERNVLPKLGILKPSRTLPDEVYAILSDLKNYRKRLEKYRDVLMPKVKWRD